MKLSFLETVQLNELRFGDIKDHSIYQKALANPKFQRWFGDSKVRDENGDPLICFHGTDTEFKTFHSLSHFGTKEAANTIASLDYSPDDNTHIIPVFLRIINPVRLFDISASHDNVWSYLYPMFMVGAITASQITSWLNALNFEEDFYQYIGQKLIVSKKNNDDVIDGYHKFTKELTNDKMLYFRQSGYKNNLLRLLKKLGIDGFVYENTEEDIGNDSWIITSPGQVLPVFHAYRFANENASKGEAV